MPEPSADNQPEKTIEEFPNYPGKFVPADKPVPGGGKVVLYSRSRYGNYPLATYAFQLGLRGDNAQVANYVNLIFGNRTREDAFGGDLVNAGPPSQDGNRVAGAAGMDGNNGDSVDEFRVNCYGGSRNRIVDLGESDFAKIVIPKELQANPADAVDDVLNTVPVKVGHVYVIHIHGKDQDGEMKAFYVKVKVLQHRDNDAVLLEWAPLEKQPGN